MNEALPGAQAALLAEGFARQAESWARARGASAEAARAARQAAQAVSLATSNGHVCVSLHELAARDDTAPFADAAAWRAALLASGVVGTAEAPSHNPLVLDGDGRLYLHRYFDYERRLAARLLRAQAGESTGAAPADNAEDRSALRQRLEELFTANAAPPGTPPDAQPDPQPDWQKLAVALALRGRLTVVSGGPGTGKTTTVVNLLACLLAQNPACRIALAAPTGKAAARMTDAIRQRAAHLPAAIRERLPAESSTIHRLLGVTPAAGGFVHHAGNPLAIDALVVDEASMLDLALATRLLEAVPPSARIVLLGDKDQLAAVEAGAVFSELSAVPSLSAPCRADLAALCGVAAESIVPPDAVQASPLRDAAVWFRRNFRFAADSAIGRLAAGINSGRAEETLAGLRAASDPGVRWIDNSANTVPDAIEQAMAGYAAFLDSVRGHHSSGGSGGSGGGGDGGRNGEGVGPGSRSSNVTTIGDAFGRFRVLCAVREGPRGVAGVNAEIAQRFRHALGAADRDPRSAWYPGRPVLVLRNDAVLKLFNGDIGITLPAADGTLKVFFPQADGSSRAIAPMRLPAHETAFAMTVHKSQGSEFDAVLVLLPAQRSRVATRELLYTAVTRARRHVTLWAGAAALASAIETSTRRHSGLLARLREQQGLAA